MIISVPSGTRDTLPSEVYKWHYVEKKFAEICNNYGFSEIRTPEFEHTRLFTTSVGDTTDIVQKKMYTFDDLSKESMTLKLEGTSPVCRSYIENKRYTELQPAKYYYITPCFRHESFRSGNLNVFHQFGVETFGTIELISDLECICLCYDFLREMGFDNIKIKINSAGCPVCRPKFEDRLREYFEPAFDSLCTSCKDRYERNPMRILECSSPVCRELAKDAPRAIDFLDAECRESFEQLQKKLDLMNIKYEIDTGIIRDLDYYTKTAFEVVLEKNGEEVTLCGGGRYDHLIEQLGGPPIPGVGFGITVEKLLEFMADNDVDIPKPDPVEAVIAPNCEAANDFVLLLCRRLHQKGRKVHMDTLIRNQRGHDKYARYVGAKKMIVIGEKEMETGMVDVRDMQSDTVSSVPLDSLYDELIRE